MAITAALYNNFKKNIMNGVINLASDTIKVMLTTSSYAPNIDTHEFKSSVTNEVASAGYTAGGATLANKAVTTDTTDDEGVFDADDVVWSAVTLTTRYAVIYKSTGVDATSPLLGYIDFGADQAAAGTDFTIRWATEGILNLN